jgi:hypothetical protein
LKRVAAVGQTSPDSGCGCKNNEGPADTQGKQFNGSSLRTVDAQFGKLQPWQVPLDTACRGLTGRGATNSFYSRSVAVEVNKRGSRLLNDEASLRSTAMAAAHKQACKSYVHTAHAPQVGAASGAKRTSSLNSEAVAKWGGVEGGFGRYMDHTASLGGAPCSSGLCSGTRAS